MSFSDISAEPSGRGRFPPITNLNPHFNFEIDFRKQNSKILLRSKVIAMTDQQTNQPTNKPTNQPTHIACRFVDYKLSLRSLHSLRSAMRNNFQIHELKQGWWEHFNS